MPKTRVELEQEAAKMVDALEVVFTLSRGLMPTFGFTESETNIIFERAAFLFYKAHRKDINY